MVALIRGYFLKTKKLTFVKIHYNGEPLIEYHREQKSYSSKSKQRECIMSKIINGISQIFRRRAEKKEKEKKVSVYLSTQDPKEMAARSYC